MRMSNGWRLAYCTNIHRGESWEQTRSALEQHTLSVRDRVCGRETPFAIGLRLGAEAARDLADRQKRLEFRDWLARENAFVFTINGFPYGSFHGVRVKEDVYRPDWTTTERVEYTQALFHILADILPEGESGSVSTVPASYKEFIQTPDQVDTMIARLWEMVEFLEDLSNKTGRDFHLGLEPEPLCYLETSAELIAFFERLRAARPGDDRIDRRLGVNYDTCHLAIEYEAPEIALRQIHDAGIRLSKVHLSSAIKTEPTEVARTQLRPFADPVYFHQVVEKRPGSDELRRYRDLDDALKIAETSPPEPGNEWRVHFHIPLHESGTPPLLPTQDHVSGAIQWLQARPELCQHFEMETYTWETLPNEMRTVDVVDQLAKEYEWTFSQLKALEVYPSKT